ncbi:hypothetical protein Cpir12675_001476 [Ceratocystis pirilliformis]|uniref:Alpha/beta hydrolase fold-3 domain-containing protein n=1 Tax=Ceratocystis pirilliformis TaxID=259994 RepID=A0ABR3ZG37_9PEZI
MNSTSVSVAEIPTVIRTFVSHYISKKNSPEKPTSHLRYDQGLNLVRGFIDYSSTHTVEELQSFTSQWVPHPTWVRVQRVTIPSSILDKAAVYLQAELGEEGLAQVGGRNWWQWRLPGSNLDAEWVEMKSDYQDKQERENDDSKDAHQPRRVMFYLHGGAYYFGGVNEHRYQLQRHARKLKARVFAPEYRLAPQFPFPCGLQDALAAYMSLLVSYNPIEIIFAGDSAGGALALSLLVVLRNQNLPLPSGAILLSPWVDLNHSFPSVTADPALDYVPSDGFHHKPSKAWPPPTYEEWEEMCKEAGSSAEIENAGSTKEDQIASTNDPSAQTMPPSHITIVTENEVITVKEQVQMYAPNHLLSHPLVSPIMQPTLGGLPPVMIVTGGAELLRDEQIFIAHKLANPQRYAAPDLTEAQRAQVAQYPPTLVQLQVWDHLCHVATTLSFTEPAKYMFRSIAQFGAWALNVPLDATGPPEDSADVPGTTSSVNEGSVSEKCKQSGNPIGKIGGAGEPLPQFVDSMIRQRVDKNGNIYELASAFTFPFCDPPDYTQVGKVKPVPIKRWLSTRAKYDSKYARIKRDIRKETIEDIRGGFIKHGDGENPPLSALAGRYLLNPVPRKSKLSKITVPHTWSLWGSKHDEHMMQFRRKQREAHEAEEKDMKLNVVTSQDSTDPQSPSASSSVSPFTIVDDETVGIIDSSGALPNTLEEIEPRNTELLDAVSEKQPELLKKEAEKEVEAQSILSGQSSCLSSDTSGSSLGQTRADKFYEAQEAIGINNEESSQDTSLSIPQESELAATPKPPLPPRPSAERVTSDELEIGMTRATDNVAPGAASEEQPGLAKPVEVVRGKLVGKAAWTPPESPVRVRPKVSTTNLPSIDPLSPISPICLPLSRDDPAIPNLSALIPEKPTNPPPEIPKSAQTAKSIRSVKSTKSTNGTTVKSPKSPRSPKSLNRISPTRDILNNYSAPTTAPPQKELPKLPPGQLPKITLLRTQLPPAVNLNPWEASAPPTTALPPLPKMPRTGSDRRDPTSHDLERFPTQVEQPLEGEDDPENVLSLVDSKAPIASIPTKELVPCPGVRKLSSLKSVPPLTVNTVLSTPVPPPKDLEISQDQGHISTMPSIAGVEAFPSNDVSRDKNPENASFTTNNSADRLDPLDGSAAQDGTQGKDSQMDTAQEVESLATVATPQQSTNSWDHLVEVSPPLPEKDLPRSEKVLEAPSPTKSAKPGRKRLWPWSRSSTEKNNATTGPVPSTQQTAGPADPNNPPVYSTLSPESWTNQQSWTRFPAWRSQVDMLIDQRRTREKEKAAKGEVETGVVGKRPMLGGIALPFSLGRKTSTESLRTLHSDEAVEPQLK